MKIVNQMITVVDVAFRFALGLLSARGFTSRLETLGEANTSSSKSLITNESASFLRPSSLSGDSLFATRLVESFRASIEDFFIDLSASVGVSDT